MATSVFSRILSLSTAGTVPDEQLKKVALMNTYYKFYPNVWLAKTTETYTKNDTILIANKYGRESEHKVHNLVFSKNGLNFYSVERLGETYAERKAKRYETATERTKKTADSYYEKSNKDRDFLVMGEPVKVGHHSENRHRKIIAESHNNMRKFCEASDKAREQERRAEYWKMKADEINLSSPESIEFFTAKLEQATGLQQAYKTGKREQEHSYSLSYATKAVKDIKEKLEIAVRLWGFSEPETIEPETIEPETIEPETIEPETIEPETIEPETIEPTKPAIFAERKKDFWGNHIEKPETTEPETIEPTKPAKKQTPAQAVKSELQKAFPCVKFTAKYRTYSGGCSVDISWTNGPAVSAVRAISQKYQYNGRMQIDDYVPASNLRADIPQAGYVFENRTIEATIEAEIRNQIEAWFNFGESWDEWSKKEHVNSKKSAFFEWYDFSAGGEPLFSEFIAYEQEEQAKKHAERKAREQVELAKQAELERLETIENEKMYLENNYSPVEIEEHKTGTITTGKVKIYDAPVCVASVWPNMNKYNRLSSYHAELFTGESTRKTARIMGEIVLSDNSARTYAESLLWGQNFISGEFKGFCGHDFPSTDSRPEEFETIEKPCNMSENKREHFREKSETICFIVKSEICTFLVNSEGYNYAKYVGFIE